MLQQERRNLEVSAPGETLANFHAKQRVTQASVALGAQVAHDPICG